MWWLSEGFGFEVLDDRLMEEVELLEAEHEALCRSTELQKDAEDEVKTTATSKFLCINRRCCLSWSCEVTSCASKRSKKLPPTRLSVNEVLLRCNSTSSLLSDSSNFTSPLSFHPIVTLTTMFKRYDHMHALYLRASMVLEELADHVCLVRHSGVSRTLRTSGFTRPSAARRAIQPLTKNLGPSITARYASTDGKIHQVIGAVVDGMGHRAHLVCQGSSGTDYKRQSNSTAKSYHLSSTPSKHRMVDKSSSWKLL